MLLVFDLDGTLLDTAPDLCASMNAVLVRFGYSPVTTEFAKECVGNGARSHLEKAAGEQVSEEAVCEYKRAYLASDDRNTRPYPGSAEFLARMKERGAKLAILSNKPQEKAARLVEKFFPNTFDAVAGDSGNFPLKPDPAALRFLALSLREPLASCLLIGDGETDVLTARNAHIPCISALWGYRSRERLLSAGAKLFAEGFEELEKITAKFF